MVIRRDSNGTRAEIFVKIAFFLLSIGLICGFDEFHRHGSKPDAVSPQVVFVNASLRFRTRATESRSLKMLVLLSSPGKGVLRQDVVALTLSCLDSRGQETLPTSGQENNKSKI